LTEQTTFVVSLSGRTKALLYEVAREIEGRGGKCISVQVDHSKDSEVEAFFKKVDKDENGQLDVLVNNAFAAVSTIFNSIGKSFWTLDPVNQWDTINGVGLRGHYLATVYASRSENFNYRNFVWVNFSGTTLCDFG
jgi:dehydrogenase/reductase SDR family protein 1